MKLNTITIGGFLRFTDPVTLDLRGVPDGLVAITGTNGSGKTALIESAMAALYREFPSRGDLAPYATSRDSFIEATFATAEGAYRARVNVDGIRRTTDAVLELTEPDGSTRLLNDGKATTYDQVVRQRFPSQDLLLASAFAAQSRAGDFITKKPAQRRELFGEMLGLTALTTMGATAKTLATMAEGARSRLASIRSLLQAETLPAAFEALDAEDTAQALKLSDAKLRRAEVLWAIADLEGRLAVMSDAVAAHTLASERVTRLRDQIAKTQAAMRAIVAGRTARDTQFVAEGERAKDRHTALLADIDKKLAGNAQIQGMADAIRAAVAEQARLDEAIAILREDIDEAAQQRDAMAATQSRLEQRLAALGTVEQQQRRAQADIAILGSVPCGDTFPDCQFLQNAHAAKAQLADLVAQLAPKAALAEEVGKVIAARDTVSGVMASYQAHIKALVAERASHDAMAQYAGKLEASEARVVELHGQRARAEADYATFALELEHRQAQDHRECEDHLAALQADVDALTPELAQAEAALAGVADRHTEAAALTFQLQQARGEQEQLVAAIATAEATRQEYARRRQALARKVATRTDVEARLAQVETELLDWQLLAKALGKDGLPDLEIDAAGPTISAFTNELLEVCHGPRFSLELVTQVATADGKGQKSDFTVQVTDNASGGTARDISDLSGGEQVVVSEALRSALSVYVNQRSHMPVRTCWRDETTGALDPENAVKYVAMLRKLRELGGYDTILFITHNPDVAAMADAQVLVADGRVTVLDGRAAA